MAPTISKNRPQRRALNDDRFFRGTNFVSHLRHKVGELQPGHLHRKLVNPHRCRILCAMAPGDPVRSAAPTAVGFHTTHWTLVLAAQAKDGTVAREALAA